MPPTVTDLAQLMAAYMPPDLSLQRMLYALGTILLSQTFIQFNENQRRHPHQTRETGWEQAMKDLVVIAFDPPSAHPALGNNGPLAEQDAWDGQIPTDPNFIQRIVRDLPRLLELLNWPLTEVRSRFAICIPVMLHTTRLNCHFCDDTALVKEKKITVINVLGEDLRWGKGIYVMARCRQCSSRYYVDRFTYRHPEPQRPQQRLQQLEYDTQYLCISQKDLIFVHRSLAQLQEGAMFRYKSSWSGFADFLNRTLLTNSRSLNAEQTQKLFVENFARRLLQTHGHAADFTCSPNPNAEDLAKEVLKHIGENGGMVPGALTHMCTECTHEKRFQTPEYIRLNQEYEGIVGVDDIVTLDDGPTGNNLDLGTPHTTVIPNSYSTTGEPKQWVRMAVMDGKTLSHKICAIQQCPNPLTNYKTGRFCKEHIGFDNICAIIDCNQPLSQDRDGITCNSPDHKQLYKAFLGRFAHSSFLGVRRAIAKKTTPRQFASEDNEEEERETPLRHRFRARRIYCIQTIQWACGTPIAWGKCYDSESLSQVFGLCNSWFPPQTPKPQFLAYDKACKLLSHIITQHGESDWIRSTRFIVDAFHYINHRATDRLCRERCNPAPSNGSQPDLVNFERDRNGRLHAKRAFNTETAEQFNAWMDGFESQLRSMKHFNFDFFIHAIMLLYKEEKERNPPLEAIDI